METRNIPICEHEGYSIELRMPAGVFDAHVEDTHVTSQNLEDLKARLTALTKKAREQSRRATEPVRMWIVDKEGTLKLYDVLGFVAGRQYNAILRTKQGQLNVGNDMVKGLRVDDARITHVQMILQRHLDAQQAYIRARRAWDDCVKSLPAVDVPSTKSKEEVYDAEPAFLNALRNIPVERDSADRENTGVPA